MTANKENPPSPARRRLLAGALGTIAGLAATPASFRAQAGAQGLAARTRAGLAFGTTVSLTAAGPDPVELEEALSAGFRVLREVEAAASLLRPDTAIARLNRDGTLRDPPVHLVTLLRFALDLATASKGAFDPTVQPLWTCWAGAAARGGLPSAAAVAVARARVGWRDVRLASDRIGFARPDMGLTLNGLAQGFAADRVMAALTARGIDHAFVDTGEFGAVGNRADGAPWRLGIAQARRNRELAAVIDPFVGFAATSGDGGIAFSPDRRDHHIFDPATGHSPNALSSITVTAPSGLLADGLSTAAFVLGPEAGARLVARYPGCVARFTTKS